MPEKEPKTPAPEQADVKSVEEFRRLYLPRTTSDEEADRMSPQEFGETLAKESLKKVKELLSQ